MKQFWSFTKRYMLPYKWWYIAGVFFIAGTQLLAVSIIETVKDAIDAISAGSADKTTVLPFVGWIALFAVLIIVVRTTSRLLVFTPGRMIEYRIRNDFYGRLLHLQRNFYGQFESGDLVSRCSNDVAFIRAAYGFGILQVANVAITFAVGLVAMLRMDWKTTVFLAIPMLLSFGVIQLGIRIMFRHWRAANVEIGNLSSLCLASYKGVSAIQNYHAEPAVEARFDAINDQFLDTQTVVTRIRSFTIPMVQFIGNLSVFTVFWFVGPKVIDGQLTLGQVTAFLGYISMVMPPLLSLGWMLNVFNRAIPAMERLDEVLLAEPNLPPVTAQLPQGEKPHLVCRGIKHRFQDPEDPDNSFLLDDVQFDLPQGKILGIVGPVGSGKTALVETLLRLNPLEAGMVYVDGVDVQQADINEYRNLFSFVPQRSFLFSTSLRNNLRVSLPAEQWDDPNLDEHLKKHLEIACFKLDPKQFPEGLDTQVGEKGIMLSGGQRQRIALARALLRPASIYILDDVLSAVDHETEAKIIRNMRQFAPDKSMIIVAHRISAVAWADEVLVLDEGRVRERGSHTQLIERQGYYRDIYQYQSQKLD